MPDRRGGGRVFVTGGNAVDLAGDLIHAVSSKGGEAVGWFA
jgi:hypothetical protein